MFLPFFVVVGIVFGVPDLSVRYEGQARDSVTIAVQGADDRLPNCLESGFEIRYRFEMKLCTGASDFLWNDCRSPRQVIRTLEYDAISESYKITSDVIADTIEPERSVEITRQAALDAMATLKSVPLSLVGWGKNPEQRYLLVRLISDCKGEYNETLARIGYFLSLGIVRFNENNTGWISFTLK